jgi:hypothetical protein
MPSRRSPEPTKKQRYWMGHLVACGKSGRRLSDYAATHGLNLQRLYSWKTYLQGRGLLPSASGSSKPTIRPRRPIPDRRSGPGVGVAPVRFAAVHLSGGEGPSPALRVRFPNGIIVETTGAGAASVDRDLLSYLAGLP